MFVSKNSAEPEFTQIVEVDIGSVEPSVAGPRRPQDRNTLGEAGEDGVRESFRLLAGIRERMLEADRPELPLDELSMGMTGDFEIAIAEGATLLRIGSALFAEEAEDGAADSA